MLTKSHIRFATSSDRVCKRGASGRLSMVITCVISFSLKLNTFRCDSMCASAKMWVCQSVSSYVSTSANLALDTLYRISCDHPVKCKQPRHGKSFPRLDRTCPLVRTGTAARPERPAKTTRWGPHGTAGIPASKSHPWSLAVDGFKALFWSDLAVLIISKGLILPI